MNKFIEGFEKRANMLVSKLSQGVKTPKPKANINKAFKLQQPKIPKPSQDIRGLTSMKI